MTSTLSAADSHAKTSALQEKAQDLKEIEVDSGSNSTGSSKKSARVTRSSKTSQPFAVEDWIKSSGHSLRSGTMRNGIVYPLPPLAHLTAGTESGLWPTPTSSTGGANNQSKSVQAGKHGINLAGAVKMWPTPTTFGFSSVGQIQGIIRSADSLEQAIAMTGRPQTTLRMWPTPCSRDYKDNGKSPAELARNSKTLATHAGGKLNPVWVEWLMGFPNGWTDLNN